MAINKNFVIKNGVQVATDLIVGDSDTKKVGIGTTIAGYTLHVGATNVGGRGGIGATDLNITGVGTVTNFNVTGLSTFANDVSVSGMVSAQALSIGTTEVIDRGLRLSGIASLDATTTATIEEAIRVGPNSFSDLKVSGISTFVGIATFATGLDVVSGVSTFGAPLRIGFAGTTDHAGVALGATVGFGTSAFFQDGAAIYMGDDSDLKIFHDSSNSFIQDLGTGNLYVDSNSLQIRNATGTETQATFTENGAVSLFYDNGNVVQTTPQGINVSGVTTSNRLNISGVSTFTSIGSNLIPDGDGSRNIGAAGSEWQDLHIDGTANIDTLAADTAAIADLTDNRIVIAGSGGELEDSGNLTFDGSTLAVTGDQTVSSSITVSTGATISANGNAGFAGIVTAKGVIDANGGINAASAKIEDLTDNRIVIAGTGGELEDSGNLTFDGSTLAVTGDETVSGKISIGSGVTAFANGNVAVAGITTINGDTFIGAGVTIQPHGGVSIAGIVTIGGNLNVQGDIVYDEITGRNLNITGISTQAGQVNFGTSGVGATIAANGNASFSGIVTAVQFQGGGVGVGIGSTTDNPFSGEKVGYGFTFIKFAGPGVSTVYADTRAGYTGFATVFIEGGGSSVGAAGTWQNDQVGISTAKSVGVNTSTINDADLQGRPHVGAAGSFQGLYIGNGMIVNDNQLNGDHYIGTAFGGMMAGPVTINGVLTVDGNYVVV